jgi:iron complex outermembrane recepter protein
VVGRHRGYGVPGLLGARRGGESRGRAGRACGIGTGSGDNPNLRPILSDNFDAGLEWYFEPKALLAADVSYMSLHDCVGLSTVNKQFETFNIIYPNGFLGTYAITEPYNGTGRVGTRPLCLKFAQQGLDPMWALDWLQVSR